MSEGIIQTSEDKLSLAALFSVADTLVQRESSDVDSHGSKLITLAIGHALSSLDHLPGIVLCLDWPILKTKSDSIGQFPPIQGNEQRGHCYLPKLIGERRLIKLMGI